MTVAQKERWFFMILSCFILAVGITCGFDADKMSMFWKITTILITSFVGGIYIYLVFTIGMEDDISVTYLPRRGFGPTIFEEMANAILGPIFDPCWPLSKYDDDK